MPTTTRILSAAALASSALLLGACSTSQPSEQQPATVTQTVTATPSSPAPASATPSSPVTPTASRAASTSPSAASAGGSVTIVTGGTRTSFTPDIVRCSGGAGAIRHVTITSRAASPVITVSPGHVAMVKLPTGGAPHRSETTSGITTTTDGVRFDDARIGGATVTGSVTCLQRNG